MIEVNAALDTDPAAVNRDPTAAAGSSKCGFPIRGETSNLLSAADYEKFAAP